MGLAEVVGVGGPLAGVGAILGFFLKAYLEKRGADREDVKISRESESGIVETTKMALSLAREEMTAIDQRREKERAECDAEIARLKEDIRWLRQQLDLRNTR